MNRLFSGFALLVGGLLLSGCSMLSPDQNAGYSTEFGSGPQVGMTDTSNMSPQEIHAEIQRAYLDGELTKEQAHKAHLQLDVKGHLTAEQVAVINRDRLAKRDNYETRKEQLDVIRDVTQTGSSVTGDVNNTLNTIRAIFK